MSVVDCVEANLIPGKHFATEIYSFLYVWGLCHMSVRVGKVHTPVHVSEARRRCQVPSSVTLAFFFETGLSLNLGLSQQTPEILLYLPHLELGL